MTNELGRYLRECREVNDWTQRHMAEIITGDYEVPTTAAVIGNVENGRTLPSFNLLGAYIDIFEIPVMQVCAWVGWVFPKEAHHIPVPPERARQLRDGWVPVPKQVYDAVQSLNRVLTENQEEK